MFDHVTLRVPDLAAATNTFSALFDQLDVEQTTSTASFSVWGNFALTQTDDEHPIARRVQIAFTAPTSVHEATTHFNGQSTVTFDGNRAAGESYRSPTTFSPKTAIGRS